MQKDISQAIKYIINTLDDENKCNSKIFLAMLGDIVPNLTDETRIFKHVLTDEVLSRILFILSSESTSIENKLLYEKKRLEDDFGLSDKWSIFIVDSFAKACDIECNFAVINNEQVASKKIGTTEENDTAIQNINQLKRNNVETLSYKEQRYAELIKKRTTLIAEKSKLGFFSHARKKEIDELLIEIETELSEKSVQSVCAYEKSKLEKNAFNVTNIQVFSSNGMVDGKKLFGNTFYNGETKYIGVKLSFKKVQYNRNADLLWQIYDTQGKPYSNIIRTKIEVPQGQESVFQAWGWSKTGNWQIGKYTIVASINNGQKYQIKFEISNGCFDSMPVPLKKVKIFNGSEKAPPLDKREYSQVFSKSTARRLYFQLEFQPPRKDISTTIDFVIRKSSQQSAVANCSVPILIKYNFDKCWTGWGWNDAGNWETGEYNYSISLGKTKPISGKFYIVN